MSFAVNTVYTTFKPTGKLMYEIFSHHDIAEILLNFALITN